MGGTSRLEDSSCEERPLVTFFLFAYNQEKYIEDACRAALQQTYSPLEIIFSDDCSSDKTFDLIKKIVGDYDGPHKVVLNRNEKNLGLIGHVNKSFGISSGDLMVVAAGDDISLPDRVEVVVDVYLKNRQKPVVIHSSALKINDSNDSMGLYFPPVIEQNMDIFQVAASKGLYIGATAAWSRLIYKDFGPIIHEDSYEDLVLGFRAALRDSLIYVDQPLVRYRFGVGVSVQRRYSFLDVRKKVEGRLRLLKINKSVYKQRLMDVGCAGDRGDVHYLRKILVNCIFLEERRIDFYVRPLSVFRSFFSVKFFLAAKAVLGELKFLIKK